MCNVLLHMKVHCGKMDAARLLFDRNAHAREKCGHVGHHVDSSDGLTKGWGHGVCMRDVRQNA